MNKKKLSPLKCNARAIVDSSGKCSRNKVVHSAHSNHEHIYKNMVTKNSVIEKCLAFKETSKGLSIKVPAYDIFTMELAK